MSRHAVSRHTNVMCPATSVHIIGVCHGFTPRITMTDIIHLASYTNTEHNAVTDHTLRPSRLFDRCDTSDGSQSPVTHGSLTRYPVLSRRVPGLRVHEDLVSGRPSLRAGFRQAANHERDPVSGYSRLRASRLLASTTSPGYRSRSRPRPSLDPGLGLDLTSDLLRPG